ncbi:preprotein translocase subunit SecG [Cellvibrio zantedeschiae]|uniref:Protein-export membrane protein SecG n=1 Tax=Cellvibrio zantedeschiae TaxID=1237077 RepID=A0ABQ3B422_9GAMM|nr:preprotein translocase subunit SecG [Cellvibrio zantedeschiae]GGY74163.1 preprotein translocase subunit SecG [Cellvibrio zantedeschiae]
MEKLVLVIHSISALAIIVLILLQQGKGAAAGASFGSGASQTVFGSDGGSSFFTRATAIFATIFFVLSLTLAVMAKNHSKVAVQGIPAVPAAAQQAPVAPASDVPATNQAAPAASDVPATAPEQSK